MDCQVQEDFRYKLDKVNRLWEKNKVEFSWDTFTQISDIHNETIGYRIACGKIKGPDYRKLRGKCKELGITVNSAITTAIAATLQKQDSIHAIIALNARPLLGFEEDKGIANYASCINFKIQYNSELDFWENAQRINEQLKKARNDKAKILETLHSFLLLNADIFGATYHARYGMYNDREVLMAFKDALGTGAEGETFDISNIGNVTFDAANEEFVVRDCYFIPNLPLACDCAFGVVSLNNTLTFSLGYKANLESEDQMKNIIANIKEKILDF